MGGTIPSSIGSLAALTIMYVRHTARPIAAHYEPGGDASRRDVSNNQLSGAVPSSVGSMSNLNSLCVRIPMRACHPITSRAASCRRIGLMARFRAALGPCHSWPACECAAPIRCACVHARYSCERRLQGPVVQSNKRNDPRQHWVPLQFDLPVSALSPRVARTTAGATQIHIRESVERQDS